MSANPSPLHHDELLQVLRDQVANRLPKIRSSLQRYYEKNILPFLKRGEAPVFGKTKTRSDRWPAAIHNKYQWWANAKGGVCQGTLYRSANYMAIPLNQRYGGNGDKKNVHLEHTMPGSQLGEEIRNKYNQWNALTELHQFLMNFSVCTALTHDEKKSLESAGVNNDTNLEFCKGLVGKPFLRYKPAVDMFGLRIFNVVTCDPINIDEFTFNDHVEMLVRASQLAQALPPPLAHNVSTNIFYL
jgi:hypothetical protein